MASLPDPLEHRQSDHDIELLFLKRWSPRAMSGEAIRADELNRLFEAARWAPSTYNEQEWRFLYAHRDTEHWQSFFDLLVEGNQSWCDRAGVLILLVSHEVFERNGKANPVHSLDAGASMQNLLLQAAAMGLVAHGMAGFDQEAARRVLNLPDDYSPEAMIAIGRPGDPDTLGESLAKMETPSGRKPVSEFTCEGGFQFS